MTARKILLATVFAAILAGFFTGCASLPQGPTYTDDELKAICERHGGWWRGNLIAGFCEFQLASQAP
ncbi:MAG TPA: hypothetical protein VJX92_17875 [Methylomirabilota bacterium]|nr:hypothetical protein [Methylomirabilota bacterium]